MDKGAVAKVLQTTHRPTVVSSCKSADSELSNDDLDELLLLLQTVNSDVAGLQPPGLGTCFQGKSLPQFSYARPDKIFVQIVNTGDHWICLTNKFSRTVNEVFVFDSMASGTTVTDQLAVFATSLLSRYDDNTSYVSFRVRYFQQQTSLTLTRLCGFYVAAVAIACCNGTGVQQGGYAARNSPANSSCRQRISAQLTPVQPILFVAQSVTNRDLFVKRKPKLYCLCHGPDNGTNMTECTFCGNWYHDTFLAVKPSRLVKRRHSAQWLGPCCDVHHEHVVDVDLTRDDDNDLRTTAHCTVIGLTTKMSTSKLNKPMCR